MNEEQAQDQYPQISPEEAKASLGLSTRLSEQLLTTQAMAQQAEQAQQQSQEAPVEAEKGSQSEAPPEVKEQAPQFDIEALKAELKDSLKKEVVDEVKKEVMDSIKDALDEQD